ncbi:hypothetical protein [Polyangium aurulentum]|uniref:hypothetical protein n=1 Tax=Polyangium aurulentum TaxID=2567896 RepID=UPI0010ADAD58|nr:hypothetical protein [Polyangium aurulentum]UQA61844.1 hypothetical protein E8A73_015775 [Polyangium aurulentum]
MASKEELVQAVKGIVVYWREGKLDEAYAGYRDLFARPDFIEHRPEDQRNALRLMIMAKGAPHRPTPAMVEAHQAAVPSLTELVNTHGEPADYEMLGICHVILGDEKTADKIFREGLARERQRNPQSDLCGAFMKRISFL